jgi:hypothetical protein
MAANEIYSLTYGSYPLTFEGLDIDLPVDSNVCGTDQKCRATKNYRYKQREGGTVS